MKTDDAIMEELDSLKARVAALEAKVGIVKAAEAARPAPRLREEERLSIKVIQQPETFVMPSTGDLKNLLEIALQHYPMLRSSNSDSEYFFRGFALAFRRLGNMERAEKPDQTKYVSFWFDECIRWLRAANYHGDISGDAFIAAAIAHGDIPFVAADPSRGKVWALGLKEYGGGRSCSGAWRKVLSGAFAFCAF
jgi:hypothetical protein